MIPGWFQMVPGGYCFVCTMKGREAEECDVTLEIFLCSEVGEVHTTYGCHCARGMNLSVIVRAKPQ